ncbi:hypothetical protein RJT34_32662 [Clitoria ternatea]|uniref:Uncharacterized protein n=1 Tax=Clitoria ternatea TaxID=43366 RepID=A0AAN9I9Q7_CLITE
MAEPSSIAQEEAVTSNSAWESSGSVGPFFAVISVLIVLAVLSCYLGSRWNRRPPTPLESIRGRGFFGWLKRMCRERVFVKDVHQVGGVGAKVMVCDHDEIHHNCMVKDPAEVAHQNPIHQV